ncbi:flavodoxin family protein [Homoserinibacter sp. YIM 151385]|uniref:flavodoxin family protein n=1 Tax=Homoserinibacter sp. YIM 151385 TaxID=2985506 RepID=UPI0022F109DF|nr:NAD(P)H-dependent oxidoreductase [Homoserinibacter sp. YIM 151385]WBU36734.1 NAD(P)H-dependent oxidoreductase [Homoserinibacter sp. YIM 151385]
MTDLTAVALVCTLKPSPERSSSELLATQLLAELRGHGVTGEAIRVVDHDVKPGVEDDMGEGDAWPEIRDRVRAADILVLTTPTWMGHPTSVAARVLERLDAELSETDEEGRPGLFGKVAIVGVVGNEDGAHKIVADVFQALDDVGYSIPAQGCTYWNDEAMGSRDYQDLDGTPEATAGTTRTAAANAAHLAGILRQAPYPAG